MSRQTASPLVSPLVLLVLGGALVPLAPGCQTSGYQRAHATAKKTTSYREDLAQLGREAARASEALGTLGENPGDSPRSNQGTFRTFTRELANLEASAERIQKAYGRLDGRAELFFAGWSTDAERIASADLKASAAQRKQALEASFATLEKGQSEVAQVLERHLVSLRDLRLYLEHDLTAAGIESARPTLARVHSEGAALEQRIAAQIRAAEEAQEALEPLRELAPERATAGTR